MGACVGGDELSGSVCKQCGGVERGRVNRTRWCVLRPLTFLLRPVAWPPWTRSGGPARTYKSDIAQGQCSRSIKPRDTAPDLANTSPHMCALASAAPNAFSILSLAHQHTQSRSHSIFTKHPSTSRRPQPRDERATRNKEHCAGKMCSRANDADQSRSANSTTNTGAFPLAHKTSQQVTRPHSTPHPSSGAHGRWPNEQHKQ
jgi:hypothetical protein